MQNLNSFRDSEKIKALSYFKWLQLQNKGCALFYRKKRGDTMRGVSFEIPNKYGRQLFEILKDVDVSRWEWQIGGGEAYVIEEGGLGKDLFGTIISLTGKELLKLISENEYYLIFADLKAYKNVESELEIETYEDFLESDCQFVFLLVDSSFVTIYSKSKSTIQSIYTQAVAAKYKEVEYITDDNDDRTTLIAF